VYRFLLAVANTEPHCHRLATQQQLTQRPVTTPRPPSTTPLRHGSTTQLTKYAAPPYYNEATKYYCSQLLHRGSSSLLHQKRLNTTLKRQSTTLPRSTQPQLRRPSLSPVYYTEAAPSYYVAQKYYTDAPVHYTTTYATPSYYTEAKFYTGKVEYYTTTMLPHSTTPKPPSTTQSRSNITQPLCCPSLLHRT
jgi:hypothetical protein